MTCKSCEVALLAPRIDGGTPGCDGCLARALAATGAHEESARVERITDGYKAALVSLFGIEWAAGHAQVKTWGARMRHAA